LTRPRVVRLFGLGVAVAVAVAVAAQVARDWDTLAREAPRALRLDLRYLGAAWVVQSVGWLLVVATWSRILDRLGGTGLPFRRNLWAHTWSSLTNVLPGSIWLPVSRVAAYRPEGVHPMVVAAAMTVEWLLLGVAGLVLYGLAAPWSHMPRAVSVVALLAAGVLAAVVLHPAVFGRLVGVVAARLGLTDAPPHARTGELVVWCAREWLVLALAGVGLYLVMRAVGPVADLADAMAVTGLTLALANLLAWLPASAVLKDATMVVLLTPLYGTFALALVVVVAWRLWLTGVQLSWAGIALAVLRHGDGRSEPKRGEPWTTSPGA
jgi:hypothetical protein